MVKLVTERLGNPCPVEDTRFKVIAVYKANATDPSTS